jgi:hypothetical protein
MYELKVHLTRADGLPATLIAAYEAFDTILLAIRGREDPATGMFAALVIAAAAAADGRDALSRAPSLPLSAITPAVMTRPAGIAEPGTRDLATGIAGIAHLLAERLEDAQKTAELPGDQDACQNAAASAREIHALLVGHSDE